MGQNQLIPILDAPKKDLKPFIGDHLYTKACFLVSKSLFSICYDFYGSEHCSRVW